jgi:hypothetical protein
MDEVLTKRKISFLAMGKPSRVIRLALSARIVHAIEAGFG